MTHLHKHLGTALLLVLFLFVCAYIGNVEAYSLNTLSDTQSTLKISTPSDHTILFVTPSGVNPGNTISFDFSGYDISAVDILDIDFATSTSASCSSLNEAPLAATPNQGTWGVATSSNTITLTSGTATIPPNRCLRLKVGSNATFGGSGTTHIVNPGTPGNYTVTIGGTFGDDGVITNAIITDDTIALTGTVPQSLSFTISSSTIYFGMLSEAYAKYASSVDTSGSTTESPAHTMMVSTNAPFGFTLTVRGQTLTSLQNSANTITPIGATAASSAPGTEQFGLHIEESGGTGVTVDPTYAATSSYGYDATGVISSLVAQGSGSTPASTLSAYYLANISPNTEAGTYAANLTYVATANF